MPDEELTAGRDLQGHYLYQGYLNGHPFYKRFKGYGELRYFNLLLLNYYTVVTAKLYRDTS